jgi:CheY-like chemotaxis protein
MSEKKILVVDDDFICLRYMNDVLEDRYILKSARSGEEALELASDFKPDLVVLDVMMPGIDGFEVFQSLQGNISTRQTKIIFVSAKELDIEKEYDINAHGHGFLLKPFGPAELENQINDILTD